MLLSRKRPHSPDFPNEHSCERNNCCITFVLDAESPRPTDEDSESLNSIHMANTVSAKDTTDTSWSSDESVTMEVEFEELEVASLTNSDEKLMSNCDSSGSDDMLYTAATTAASVLMAAHLREDKDLWADSSDLDSDSTTDSEVPRADYWKCVRCKSKCTPLTSSCLKCFKLRKGYYPERPRPRRRRAARSRRGTDTEQVLSLGSQSAEELPGGKLEKGDSGISLGTNDEQHSIPESKCSSPSLTPELLLGSQDSAPPEEVGRESLHSQSALCFMCVERPRNGVFVHKTTAHVLCCYQCSLKVWNRTKKCPLCNRQAHNVLRLIHG